MTDNELAQSLMLAQQQYNAAVTAARDAGLRVTIAVLYGQMVAVPSSNPEASGIRTDVVRPLPN